MLSLKKNNRKITPTKVKEVSVLFNDLLFYVTQGKHFEDLNTLITTSGGMVIKTLTSKLDYAICKDGEDPSFFNANKHIQVRNVDWCLDCADCCKILDAEDKYLVKLRDDQESKRKKRRTEAELNQDFATSQSDKRLELEKIQVLPTPSAGSTVLTDEMKQHIERCIKNSITAAIPSIVLGTLYFTNEWVGAGKLPKTGFKTLNHGIEKTVVNVLNNCDYDLESTEGKEKYRQQVLSDLKKKYFILLKDDDTFDRGVREMISNTMKEKKRQCKTNKINLKGIDRAKLEKMVEQLRKEEAQEKEKEKSDTDGEDDEK
ncbi:hypothetical protein AKO1_001770 [Acrasis kona]|uniref:BRCT domain-containing protein n=1 Tax=Acrasis kona TaxID=1008807 RepID=A0AAW2YV52_9EUKA